MKQPDIIQSHSNIILFDGVCNVCSAFLKFVYKYDANAIFKFSWIQSEAGTDILNWLDMPTTDYNTIVYIENGVASFKSTAFLRIVKYLKFPWPIFQVGYILPRFFRDWIYNGVAQNRYKLFGKKDSCLIPTGDLKSRFL